MSEALAGLSVAILEGDMPWDGPPDVSHGGHRV